MKIHEFNPQIYPFRLWVAITPDFNTLNKKFLFLDKNREIVETTKEELFHGNYPAQTLPVASRVMSEGGVLVIINKPKIVGTGTIAHEAAHCADYIAETIGFPERTFDNGESYAYLLGWFADCIERAKKGNQYKKSNKLYKSKVKGKE